MSEGEKDENKTRAKFSLYTVSNTQFPQIFGHVPFIKW